MHISVRRDGVFPTYSPGAARCLILSSYTMAASCAPGAKFAIPNYLVWLGYLCDIRLTCISAIFCLRNFNYLWHYMTLQECQKDWKSRKLVHAFWRSEQNIKWGFTFSGLISFSSHRVQCGARVLLISCTMHECALFHTSSTDDTRERSTAMTSSAVAMTTTGTWQWQQQ